VPPFWGGIFLGGIFVKWGLVKAGQLLGLRRDLKGAAMFLFEPQF
jgi:hypothetical protein